MRAATLAVLVVDRAYGPNQVIASQMAVAQAGPIHHQERYAAR